jgi:hypothetical protein
MQCGSRPASIPTMMELVNQNIVDMAMFVDGTDSNGQGSLSVETACLSETFFRQLRQHAVPLDEAAIRHIHNSSMALDVYCRLAYRDRAPPRVQLKPPGQFLRAFTDCEMQGCARRATIGALRELRNMLGIFDTTTCRTNSPVGKRSRHG